MVIINKSTGTENYEWSFEGGVPSSSVLRNPGVILFEAKGVYTITLVASNQDGSKDTKSIEIQIDDPVVVDFEITNQVDTFSPASYTFQNKSTGANSYTWNFEGGTPETSTEKEPTSVFFTTPGDHTITLEVSNGRETYSMEKTITVAPYLIADFTSTVAFIDDDFQVPVSIQFTNQSISATDYQWSFEGGNPSTSSEINQEVVFTTPGIHTIQLIASNGKESKIISKQIEVFNDTNLRTYSDVILGVNTAHNKNTIGSFYAVSDRNVYSVNQITTDIASQIDLVFFGLNSSFTSNRFVSPDNLSLLTTFDPLQNGKKTIFINSQELCNCSASMSALQFDTMNDDTLLKSLTIEETAGGLEEFDDTENSRIVLFQTQEGNKGAIKIKSYVADGENSFIIVDIKMQKVSTEL